jgi:hypothetical protein
VLDFLVCFKQDRMLREWPGLEMGLKSAEVALAELAEQKALHGALENRRERKELSASGCRAGYPIVGA